MKCKLMIIVLLSAAMAVAQDTGTSTAAPAQAPSGAAMQSGSNAGSTNAAPSSDTTTANSDQAVSDPTSVPTPSGPTPTAPAQQTGTINGQGSSWPGLGGIWHRSSSSESSRRRRGIPQGTSIPGLSGVGFLDGPGYIEAGGKRSDLTAPIQPWTDLYLRGVLQPSDKNILNADIERQNRYGDAGWLYVLGLTHLFTDDFYASVDAATSKGGFFIPKYRFDAAANVKVLARKQLVISGGGGWDRSKVVNGIANSAARVQVGSTYYFSKWPVILQEGVTMTRANPGGIYAPAGYMALTEGHEKEHYITIRYETGREAYELFGGKQNMFSAFNFPIHNYSGTWRQWIGNDWGLNFTFERDVNPYFNRNGAMLGLFLDF